MSNPAVLPAVSPAVPSRQRRLNNFFVADKGVKHQRAGDGVDVRSTPAERHLLQVLATDTSNGDKEGAGRMPLSADIGCSSSGTKESTGSLLSSVPTTTSIFDEFNSVDDQDAPAAVLAAAKALRLEIHTTMGDELGAGLVLPQSVIG